MAETDILIIGAGHNGLVCAAYLAKAGLKVRMIERRHIVGGAAVTEEFHPGFRNSTASYTVSLLNPKVIADLDLHANGLKIVERDISNFWPLGTKPGEYLKLTFDPARNAEEFARHSPKDAEALPRYYEAIDKAADVLRALVLDIPPNVGGGFSDLIRAAKTGDRIRRLKLADQRLIIDLFTKSAAEFLRGYFEHPAIIGAFAFDGIVGAYASPETPGTAYVLLHHAFGEVNGKKGRWGHAVGGMGAITEAMKRVAEARGVEITTQSAVSELVVEGGRAVGVKLESGEVVRARAVAANVNPKLLLTGMVKNGALDPDMRRRMENYACGSGTFRMNVALSELPDFDCLPGAEAGEHHRSGIVIGPSVQYLEKAWLDARTYGWSREPVVEMLLPSTMDDSLAPPGKHVASLFCQQFAPELSDGRNWDMCRDLAAETIIATVTRYAPNFRRSIIATQMHSPLDLERKFGLVGGDIMHGRLSLDQMFAFRPQAGHADYRMPIKGLYLCGSGAHPGGGVTGAPGHNAAKVIIEDWKRRRF
ncbi:MAG: NAD(P)/FAD-dependent oxidoreductase [Parvularculaceae bacterium]|jgi:phytoene dehydrogenase-like protein|nr:NAD(P)/FAD-dependent oxidoreductase [Parvularculaceae bacterium]